MSVNFKITYSESPYPSDQTPGTAKIYYKKPGDADYTELIQTTTLPEEIKVPKNTELKIELNHYENVTTGIARLILNDERIATTSVSNKHITQYITIVNNIEVRLSYARTIQNRTECWVQCWMKPAPLGFFNLTIPEGSVKAITIPEGSVKEISIGGQVVWKKAASEFKVYIHNLALPLFSAHSYGKMFINDTQIKDTKINVNYVLFAGKEDSTIPVLKQNDTLKITAPPLKGFFGSGDPNYIINDANISFTSPFGETGVDAQGNLEISITNPNKDIHIYRYDITDPNSAGKYRVVFLISDTLYKATSASSSIYTKDKLTTTLSFSEWASKATFVKFNTSNERVYSSIDISKIVTEDMLDKPWDPNVGIHNYMLKLPDLDYAIPFKFEIKQSTDEPAA